MKNDNAVSRRIAQLASRLDEALVTALWIIRCASPDYQPAYEQLGILDMLDTAAGDAPALTPWHAVVGAPDAGRISAVAQALRKIAPQSPLPEQLEALPAPNQSGARALHELIEILSDLSPRDASFSRLYPRATASLAGGFAVPAGIARLLLSFLPITGASRLYDPCCGGTSLLTQAVGILPDAGELTLYGQAPDPAAYQLAQVQAYLQNLHLDLGGRPGNTLTEDLHPDRKFDCILANPPFNQSSWYLDSQTQYDPRWQYGLPPRSNGNFAWLQHVLSHLSDEGRGVVILPNGTLTTRLQSELDIRKALLRSGCVEAILAFPAGIFTATRIPCCLWLLTGPRAASPATVLVDARQLKLTEDSDDLLKLTGLIHQHRQGLLTGKTGWYAVASRADMEKQDWDLSPNFYTLPPVAVPASSRQAQSRLNALIDTLAPRLQDTDLYPLLTRWKQTAPPRHWERAAITDLYRISGGIVKNKSAFGHGTAMADVATVIRSPFLPEMLPALVDATPAELEKYRIRAGDILMNRSSENLEELACCCVAVEDRQAVYGGYLKCLRPGPAHCPDPRYMAAYFRSTVYRQEIARVSPVFTTRSNINLERLSRVSVYYPDAAAQEQLGSTMLALFRFRESCFDQALNARLEEVEQLLIAQFITGPVLELSARDL